MARQANMGSETGPVTIVEFSIPEGAEQGSSLSEHVVVEIETGQELGAFVSGQTVSLGEEIESVLLVPDSFFPEEVFDLGEAESFDFDVPGLLVSGPLALDLDLTSSDLSEVGNSSSKIVESAPVTTDITGLPPHDSSLHWQDVTLIIDDDPPDSVAL